MPELQLDAVLYKHDTSGLEHLHITKDDPNSVFSIGFATPPMNSSGVPHILEHTTLCGSQNYPVRDPFFKMLNRSLATYMNAYTAADHTVYPFSTTNATDYANLRNVYLDATFLPRLREADFRQEGWRLEHQSPGDPTSPLEFKGVVYNEMKGQMSDSSYVFYMAFQRAMFEGTIYSNDSGGDPSKITELSYADLVRFHSEHYNPRNAKMFTYGTLPAEEHQSVLNKMVENMSTSDASSPGDILQNSKLLKHSRTVTVPGPRDIMGGVKQYKTSVTFICDDGEDIVETFALKVISSLLLDGHSAPLYQALIESGIGADFSPNTGYDQTARTAVFSVGIQGCAQEDLTKVPKIVNAVLRRCAEDGFDSARIDALLHQMEIALKRQSPHFGMNMLNSIAGAWFKGQDPLKLLAWQDTVSEFKARLTAGPYLARLLQGYMLDASPALTFTMTPDEQFASRLEDAERAKLQSLTAGLGPESRQTLASSALALKTLQDTTEDVSCLPTLRVSDIAKEGIYPQLLKSVVGGVNVSWKSTSSGVTYLRLFFATKDVPDELRAYIPLFAECLTNLGVQGTSMAELETEIKRTTGGINASTKVISSPQEMESHEEGLLISMHCLDDKFQAACQILQRVLLSTDFENVDKLRDLLRMHASNATSTIVDSGHSFARSYAASSLTSGAAAAELLGGLSQLQFVTRMASSEDLSSTMQNLQRIASLLVNRNLLKCLVTTPDHMMSAVERVLEPLFHSMPNQNAVQHTVRSTPATVLPVRSLVALPYAVNFCALAIKGVHYTHPHSAVLQVLAKLMTNGYLHKELREKGGAYGGGATYSSTTGLFEFYTYRDPQTLKSLDTMAKAISWASVHDWTARDIEEAKLSIFQGIDAPTSVGSQGLVEFIDNLTNSQRQQRRERLLAVNGSQLRDAAEQILQVAMSNNLTSRAVLGRKEEFESINGWTVLDFGADSIPTTKERAASLVGAEGSDSSAQVVDQYGQVVSNAKRDQDGKLLGLEVSQAALDRLKTIRTSDQGVKLRVALESGGCHGYQYVITLTHDIDASEDVIFSKSEVEVVVDEASLELIDGSLLDYTTELIGSEFKVLNNPRAVSKCGCDTSIDIQIGDKPSIKN